MRKKAQAEQIFIYALAVIIAGGILIFGYNAIKNFTKQAEDVSYVKFKETIERDFRDIATDYGTVKIKTYEVGTRYKEVCFADEILIKNKGQIPGYENRVYDYAAVLSKHPIIQDAITTGTKYDLFLVPGEKQIDLGFVRVPENKMFICFNITSGRFSVRLEGTGSSTIVSKA